MSPELKDAIEMARNHKMSAREKFEQRVSFVYGQQDYDKPLRPKDEIRRQLADDGGWPLDEMEELDRLRAQLAEQSEQAEALRDDAEFCPTCGADTGAFPALPLPKGSGQ